MKEAYSTYQALTGYGDVVIAMCLFVGALARLTRNESIGFWAAAKEFYYSLVVGAVLTGFAIWYTEWHLLSAWWIALGAPLASSVVIEILEKKAHDLRDMDLKETVVFIFDEVQKRFKKQTTTP